MHDQDIDTIDRGYCKTKHGCCAKLHVNDWLQDVQSPLQLHNVVEVRFKNTRKDYYQNSNNLSIKTGDLVAVESSPGHDIGIVSLVGPLVELQMKKHKPTLVNGELRKIYRLAKPTDIDKWKEAIAQEHETMIKSRQITAQLNLNMKIGDVEYQGDKTKAIFYYIADDRVDFRQLIKVLAETFHIRIEMKQIGARQEAGRIGGIGPCGREICCSTWMHNFITVSTNAARYQDISPNPQKLAGQCAKLKCCLNFELASYVDAQRNFPPTNIPLETETGTFFYLKADVFRGVYLYIKQGNTPSDQVYVPVTRVTEIQKMNRRGAKPAKLMGKEDAPVVNKEKEPDTFHNVVEQGDLTRFDKPKGANRKKKRNIHRNVQRRSGQSQK